MNILQMSITAGILIIAIVAIRAVAMNKLPKTMLLALWGVALLRLIIPVSIPSQFSVYTLINDMFFNSPKVSIAIPAIKAVLPMESQATTEAVRQDATVTDLLEKRLEQANGITPTTIIWLMGMVAMIVFFAAAYCKNHRDLQFALRIRKNEFLDEWLMEHKWLRPITILQSDRLTTPVATGIIRPRIILPKIMNMDDKQLLRYVLKHEYYHLRRYDTLWKILLVATLCIHWFNPMVWVMFLLVNRDLEVTCDEMVIHHFGPNTKATYAYSLISMAEQRCNFISLNNCFSKNSAEARIIAIMKYKKPSVIAIMLAVLLVAGTTTAFAFSASVSIGSNMSTVDSVKELPDDEIVESEPMQEQNDLDNELLDNEILESEPLQKNNNEKMQNFEHMATSASAVGLFSDVCNTNHWYMSFAQLNGKIENIIYLSESLPHSLKFSSYAESDMILQMEQNGNVVEIPLGEQTVLLDSFNDGYIIIRVIASNAKNGSISVECDYN